MKAREIYKKIGTDENYIGQTQSMIEVLAETDMSRFGAFALCFHSMISYPVKSYGKIKKDYRIEVWELTSEGPELIKEYFFKTKAECLKRFKQGELA